MVVGANTNNGGNCFLRKSIAFFFDFLTLPRSINASIFASSVVSFSAKNAIIISTVSSINESDGRFSLCGVMGTFSEHHARHQSGHDLQ